MAPFRAEQEAARKRSNQLASAYIQKRRREEPAFVLLSRLRCRLYAAVRNQMVPKPRNNTSVTKRMLGCSVAELMDYLATFFAPGMSWENFGEWEIDHVKPCRAFDLSKLDEVQKCFHYTNLFPVWRSENRRKSDRWKGLRARDMEQFSMTVIV